MTSEQRLERQKSVGVRIPADLIDTIDAMARASLRTRAQVVRMVLSAGLTAINETPPQLPAPPRPTVDARAVRITPMDHHFDPKTTGAYTEALTTLHNVALGMADLASHRYGVDVQRAYYTVAVALRDVFLHVAIIGDNMNRTSFTAFIERLVTAAEERYIEAQKESAVASAQTETGKGN